MAWFSPPKTSEKHTALIASVIIGITWGLWHLPMDYIGMGQYELLFIPIFVLAGPFFLTALAILMTWVYNNTKRSLLLMILFHWSETANAIIFSPIGVSAESMLMHTIIGLAPCWLIATIVLATAGEKRLVRASNERVSLTER